LKIKILIFFILFINTLISSDIAIEKIANVPAKSLYITQPREETRPIICFKSKREKFLSSRIIKL